MKMNYVGNRLREIRKQAGYSTEKLAHFFGDLNSMIESWERGESQPTLEQWLVLSKLYDISLEKLFSEIVADDLVKEDAREEFRHEVWINRLYRKSECW